MRALYKADVGADVALTAATARSVLGIRAGATFGLDLAMWAVEGRASGSSAPTFEPMLCELCYCTFATNATPGTNNTSETPVQLAGRVMAHGMTAMSAWTAGNEPTVLTVLDEYPLHPQQGMKEFMGLGQEFDTDLNHGFVIRVTSANALSVRATLRVYRN
jgi:hypothetical protein